MGDRGIREVGPGYRKGDRGIREVGAGYRMGDRVSETLGKNTSCPKEPFPGEAASASFAALGEAASAWGRGWGGRQDCDAITHSRMRWGKL